MNRKLIIFGNGLGMALDPKHFLLENALEYIWNKEDFLSDKQKDIISKCTNSNDIPESEKQLYDLHNIVWACQAINQLKSKDIDLLTQEGKDFPIITAKYIYKVAAYLFDYDKSLPKAFLNPLEKFIKKTNSHVATLNYDKLLYEPFIEKEILKGYSGFLVDGMVGKGFQFSNLKRKNDHTFGYYLHLHGSPLFVHEDNKIIKISINDLNVETEKCTRHLVLSHIDHKPTIIEQSKVLSAYWEYLKIAISKEVNEVIIFGYSGEDKHLNEIINSYFCNKYKIRIIEWTGAGENKKREYFWKNQFDMIDNVELIQLENILEFTDW